MSDDRLRDLERRADAGDAEAELLYRAGLERAGRVDEMLERLRRAYFAGDDAAGELWTAERARLGLSVRQTGRTTRMLRRALGALRPPGVVAPGASFEERLAATPTVVVIAPTFTHVGHIRRMALALDPDRGRRLQFFISGRPDAIRGHSLVSPRFYDHTCDEVSAESAAYVDFP